MPYGYKGDKMSPQENPAMEYDKPRSRMQQLQDQICDGVVQKVGRDFDGTKLSVPLHDLLSEYNIDTAGIHPETIRALCHYASVLAGEATNRAIYFSTEPRSEWIGTGYDSQEVVIDKEFIVSEYKTRKFKRTPTHEALTPYDLERRRSKE